MSTGKAHISVCLCTFKRPELLARSLAELRGLETGGRFDYSVVVADNDGQQSAREIVSQFAGSSGIETLYCVEPVQNIALARNKAVQNARGDFVAFIDDDEFPAKDWLLTLFQTCQEHKADGVLGPVKPFFDQERLPNGSGGEDFARDPSTRLELCLIGGKPGPEMFCSAGRSFRTLKSLSGENSEMVGKTRTSSGE